MGRKLDGEEKALWQRVIASVEPMHGENPPQARLGEGERALGERAGRVPARLKDGGGAANAVRPSTSQAPPPRFARSPSPSKLGEDKNNLDGHWNRRIDKGGIVPDINIDLHDSTLSRAYARLDGALEQAVAQKMKVILLVTGKPRAHDRASGEGRGAIAALVRDWLAASRHARHISAVRTAHPRHGGAGALYIILKS